MKKRIWLFILMLIVLVGNSNIMALNGSWQRNKRGWWYQYQDGTYPTNIWKEIDGKKYHFNQWGYMDVNQWIDNVYYVGKDGAMLINAVTPDGYGVDKDGKYIVPRWINSAKGWWYRYSNGRFPVNKWELIGGKWYHFNKSGYLDVNQWINSTYYVDHNGKMLSLSRTPDGYFVGKDGAYVQKSYIDLANGYQTLTLEMESGILKGEYSYEANYDRIVSIVYKKTTDYRDFSPSTLETEKHNAIVRCDKVNAILGNYCMVEVVNGHLIELAYYNTNDEAILQANAPLLNISGKVTNLSLRKSVVLMKELGWKEK